MLSDEEQERRFYGTFYTNEEPERVTLRLLCVRRNPYGLQHRNYLVATYISKTTQLINPEPPSHSLCETFCRTFATFPMATVPGQLIWEIVKKNNSFLVKQFGRSHAGVRFSKEPNNLCNLHSYKHSGLANKKTVSIQAGGKDQSVVLATTKTRKQNKPASMVHKSVMRKEFPRMAKAVTNQVVVNFYRPDLKKAALARLSVVHRSLKVSKSGAKKRNRQAVRMYGRQ
ncbi:hypothetical protein ACLB2K_002989 [Fragaria x ananassa]